MTRDTDPASLKIIFWGLVAASVGAVVVWADNSFRWKEKMKGGVNAKETRGI